MRRSAVDLFFSAFFVLFIFRFRRSNFRTSQQCNTDIRLFQGTDIICAITAHEAERSDRVKAPDYSLFGVGSHSSKYLNVLEYLVVSGSHSKAKGDILPVVANHCSASWGN
jgi:hypothetical protein